MSIISMTGFGKSESTLNGTTCVIEVRSVNSRFLEISAKIPKNFAYLENDFKAQIKDKLARGSVNLSITLGEGNRAKSSSNTSSRFRKYCSLPMRVPTTKPGKST